MWYEDRGEKRPGRVDANNGVIFTGDNAAYGITVLFFQTPGCKGGEVRYRETFRLPAQAEWPIDIDADIPAAIRPRMTIGDDSRTCVTEQTVSLAAGQVIPSYRGADRFYIVWPFPTHEWGIAEGDPVGEWTIEAAINDKLLIRKTFTVKSRAE